MALSLRFGRRKCFSYPHKPYPLPEIVEKARQWVHLKESLNILDAIMYSHYHWVIPKFFRRTFCFIGNCGAFTSVFGTMVRRSRQQRNAMFLIFVYRFTIQPFGATMFHDLHSTLISTIIYSVLGRLIDISKFARQAFHLQWYLLTTKFCSGVLCNFS